jgi:hypothetical protein
MPTGMEEFGTSFACTAAIQVTVHARMNSAAYEQWLGSIFFFSYFSYIFLGILLTIFYAEFLALVIFLTLLY